MCAPPSSTLRHLSQLYLHQLSGGSRSPESFSHTLSWKHKCCYSPSGRVDVGAKSFEFAICRQAVFVPNLKEIHRLVIKISAVGNKNVDLIVAPVEKRILETTNVCRHFLSVPVPAFSLDTKLTKPPTNRQHCHSKSQTTSGAKRIFFHGLKKNNQRVHEKENTIKVITPLIISFAVLMGAH